MNGPVNFYMLPGMVSTTDTNTGKGNINLKPRSPGQFAEYKPNKIKDLRNTRS
jgi:hypothetical protein